MIRWLCAASSHSGEALSAIVKNRQTRMIRAMTVSAILGALVAGVAAIVGAAVGHGVEPSGLCCGTGRDGAGDREGS